MSQGAPTPPPGEPRKVENGVSATRHSKGGPHDKTPRDMDKTHGGCPVKASISSVWVHGKPPARATDLVQCMHPNICGPLPKWLSDSNPTVEVGGKPLGSGDPVDSEKLKKQFEQIKKDYQQKMGEYVRENKPIAAPISTALKENQFAVLGGGSTTNFEESLRFAWAAVKVLVTPTDKIGKDLVDEYKTAASMPVGCSMMQKATLGVVNDTLSKFGDDSEWSSMQITAGTVVQHNAVLIYPKGACPVAGYVLDPWFEQSTTEDPKVYTLNEWSEATKAEQLTGGVHAPLGDFEAPPPISSTAPPIHPHH